MDEIEKVSIWSKKADELTTGDSMKLIVGVTVAFTVIPMVVVGAAAGVAQLVENRRMRKAQKELEKTSPDEK